MKRILLYTLIFMSFCGGLKAQDKKDVSMVKNLTYSEFIQNIWDFNANPSTYVFEGKLPCVVDFYADRCGYCRKVAPIMERLAEEYKGKVIVYKVDVDQEKNLASSFGIQSIPTVLFFPSEGKPRMATGALPESEYRKAIESLL